MQESSLLVGTFFMELGLSTSGELEMGEGKDLIFRRTIEGEWLSRRGRDDRIFLVCLMRSYIASIYSSLFSLYAFVLNALIIALVYIANR